MADERPDQSDDGVLSPSDLDIADSEHVAEIGEGRYVVSTGDGPPEPIHEEPTRPAFDPDAARYGLDVEVNVDGRVSSYRTRSNDVVAVFSELASWYAEQVDADLDPARVLRILIAESDLAIGPRATVETTMERYDLTSEDAIADLLAALPDTPHR
ncbi:hypothetical protein [Halalkalicoccus sp. NIPERK01]|uniref:DUF7500 family protein n=1 Tax=Halalkalicoccus sp. NIPERK01 TaxID=3053469 RepID=UPI00256EF872|nr:hypothetical protein [Halalkalicoccus sp. NIPERK01]MDL5361091.1 hypothetical protein [Halalkalicoccus sp. NIPERK01]